MLEICTETSGLITSDKTGVIATYYIYIKCFLSNYMHIVLTSPLKSYLTGFLKFSSCSNLFKRSHSLEVTAESASNVLPLGELNLLQSMFVHSFCALIKVDW
jgi:hypothetical protein